VSGFRLVALGVGDAFSARYYSSCLALHCDEEWLLIDCPHPIRKILREASATAAKPLDLDRFRAVVITHLHADHSSGLEGLGFYVRFVVGKKAQLLTHPVVAKRIWDDHLAAGMSEATVEPGLPPEKRCLADFFDLTLLSETEPVQVGPFSIVCRPTIHTVPTYALRIQAAGRTLGYSADTAFDRSLIDWLADADLIVHETNPGLLHTPYAKLAALPIALRSRMRLIHYADPFEPDESLIEALRQGHTYEV
jgi:ribonuclease BN (tRNA processing enzyme)